MSPLRSVAPTGNPGDTGGGDNGGDPGERLARIETQLQYVATRDDISELKVLVANEISDIKVIISQTDSSRSKWMIGVMMTVVLALVSASILITTAILRLPSAAG